LDWHFHQINGVLLTMNVAATVQEEQSLFAQTVRMNSWHELFA